MIILKTAREIEKIKIAGQVVGAILEELKNRVQPGVSTAEIDRWSDELIHKNRVKSAFKGYKGYAHHICTSINEEVVHGIPSKKRKLREGDIIGLDFGVVYDGYYADAAVTVGIGKISKEAERLIRITEESLWKGIDQACINKYLEDISYAVQSHVEKEGYSVVREFVGHGIGQSLHEDPAVPNYGEAGRGIVLKEGLVLAIEPMVNMGKPEVHILNDGWTAVTNDGSLSAHFEHTVAISSKGPEVLTYIGDDNA